MWSGTAISLFFLAFRIFVRIKSFRRIYLDDVLTLIAWLMFLATASIWQSQLAAMYEGFTISSGTVIPTPEQLSAEIILLRAEFAITCMYYTSLWMIKLSFLVFFRRLGEKVRGQKIWWWCVTSFTVATWLTCMGLLCLHSHSAACASVGAHHFCSLRPDHHLASQLNRLELVSKTFSRPVPVSANISSLYAHARAMRCPTDAQAKTVFLRRYVRKENGECLLPYLAVDKMWEVYTRLFFR